MSCVANGCSGWATALVRHCIYTHFGVESCRERVRQLLHALGCCLRRLRHRQLQAKPPAQATCMAELTALVQNWPDDRELWFVDEATVRRPPMLTAPWCVADAARGAHGG